MPKFIEIERCDRIAVLRLNRPAKLNAWHTGMRDEIVRSIREFDADEGVGAIVMTGAGDRAFSAGQDLSEAHGFDAESSGDWMRQWHVYYDTLRQLGKPLVMALNGDAVGSAFQVALLGDIRIAHPDVRLGQPEINSGIASSTGPWVMSGMIGMSRTIELTLTGRLMSAGEGFELGLIHRVVSRLDVMRCALEVAHELAAKPPVAMRLNKQRFREMTEQSFKDAIEAGIQQQAAAYATGEPARMINEFFRMREKPKAVATVPNAGQL